MTPPDDTEDPGRDALIEAALAAAESGARTARAIAAFLAEDSDDQETGCRRAGCCQMAHPGSTVRLAGASGQRKRHSI